jgi:hypothetical protein
MTTEPWPPEVSDAGEVGWYRVSSSSRPKLDGAFSVFLQRHFSRVTVLESGFVKKDLMKITPENRRR